MDFLQNEKTLLFKKQVEYLLSSGEVRKQIDIVKALDWDMTMMSNVMNGRRNIPNYIYAEFIKKFPFIEEPLITKENTQENNSDNSYKDEIIKLLQDQITTLKNHNDQLSKLLEFIIKNKTDYNYTEPN